MSRSCVLTHASGVSSHVCVDARVACLNTHAHLRAVFRVSAQKRVFLHSDLHYWSSVVPHAFSPFPHMCANTPLFVSTHRIHVPDGPSCYPVRAAVPTVDWNDVTSDYEPSEFTHRVVTDNAEDCEGGGKWADVEEPSPSQLGKRKTFVDAGILRI